MLSVSQAGDVQRPLVQTANPESRIMDDLMQEWTPCFSMVAIISGISWQQTDSLAVAIPAQLLHSHLQQMKKLQ